MSLINFWENYDIEFYCTNDHDEPVPMVIMKGVSQFYACPKYMKMDEQHPDGYGIDEVMCMNRFSLINAEEIVLAFSKIVENDIMNNTECDYTGHVFDVKKTGTNLKVTVLYYESFPRGDYEKPRLHLGVLNRLKTGKA